MQLAALKLLHENNALTEARIVGQEESWHVEVHTRKGEVLHLSRQRGETTRSFKSLDSAFNVTVEIGFTRVVILKGETAGSGEA
jgi:hypothetical protein